MFHISLSSHDEPLFRCEEDLNYGFNCLALGVLETDSALLAEGFLSTHFHAITQTDNPGEVMSRTRYAYTRYFNAKYGRKGRLGQRNGFILEVDGFYHRLAVLNYVNRQGLHHGVVPTPFAYPHCSVNTFFAETLGKKQTPELLPDNQKYRFLPERASVPSYRMSTSGLLLREDVLEVAQVEAIYGTPRNYLFQMNRIGDEVMMEEQTKESSTSPLITLDLIEKGQDVSALLRSNSGKYNPNAITDVELCGLIDKHFVPKYFKGESVYDSSMSERSRLYAVIMRDFWATYHKYTTPAQLQRCLVIK